LAGGNSGRASWGFRETLGGREPNAVLQTADRQRLAIPAEVKPVNLANAPR